MSLDVRDLPDWIGAGPGVVLAHRDMRTRPRLNVLAWGCPYCGELHRHGRRGVQMALCGRGEYRVRVVGKVI